MKRFRYTAGAFVVLTAFILVSEIYVLHLDTFDNACYSFSMYIQDGISDNEMKEDIISGASKTGIECFAVERVNNNIYSEKIIIYGTAGIEKELKEKHLLSSGTYKSLVFGKVSVDIKSIREIEDMKDIYCYKALGSEEDILSFKEMMQEKYAGSLPKKDCNTWEYKKCLTAVWILVFGVLLLLGMCENMFKRKEIALRVINGMDITGYIIRKTACDTSFFTVLFLMGCVLFPVCQESLSKLLFFIFVLINIFQTVYITCKNYRKSLSDLKQSQILIALSYIFKTVTLIMFISVMTISIQMAESGLIYKNMEKHFEKYKDYSFIEINMKGIAENIEDIKKLEELERGTDELSKGSIRILTGYYGEEEEMVLLSLDSITEEEKNVFNQGCGIYIPQKKDSSKARKNAENYMLQMIGKKSKIHIYSEGMKIFCIEKKDEIQEGAICKNPIVIIFDGKMTGDFYTYYGSVMYDISKEQWNDFLDGKEWINLKTSSLTNVYNLYLNKRDENLRRFILGIAAGIAVLLMNFSITESLLICETRVYGQEKMLMRILGYNTFRIYRRYFGIIASASAIGIVIVLLLFDKTLSAEIIVAFGIALKMDIVTAGVLIGKTEKSDMNRVLKGGGV